MTWIIIPKDRDDSTETWTVPTDCVAEVFRGQQWDTVTDANRDSLFENSSSCKIIVLKRAPDEDFSCLANMIKPLVFVHLGGNISEQYEKIEKVRPVWKQLTEILSLGEGAKDWSVIPISGGSGYLWKEEITKFLNNRKEKGKKEKLYQYLDDAWKIAWDFYNLEAPSKQLAEAAFPVAMVLQGHLDQDQGYSKADLKASFDSVAEDFKEIKEKYACACELLNRFESIDARLNDEKFNELGDLKHDIDGLIEAFQLFSQRYTQIVLPSGADNKKA